MNQELQELKERQLMIQLHLDSSDRLRRSEAWNAQECPPGLLDTIETALDAIRAAVGHTQMPAAGAGGWPKVVDERDLPF